MGWLGSSARVGLVVLIAALFYPSLIPLTPELEHWRDSGSFFKFQDKYDIFFKIIKDDSAELDTLLVVHGFPTSSFDFSKILPELSKKYKTIIMFDLLGLGFSSKPAQLRYEIATQADIAEQLLTRHASGAQLHLLSHDLGDTVAQELLHRFNTRGSLANQLTLSYACFSNGGLFKETNFPMLVQKLYRVPVIKDILARIMKFFIFKHRFGAIFGPDTQPTEPEMVEFYALMTHNDGQLAAAGVLRYLEERTEFDQRWKSAMKDTSAHVAMIQGPADPINPSPGFEKYFRELLPRAQIFVFSEPIGHYPHWEAPEQFVKAFFAMMPQSGRT